MGTEMKEKQGSSIGHLFRSPGEGGGREMRTYTSWIQSESTESSATGDKNGSPH
jgi:hypothetical protein